ncbi:MAG: carboxyl transferase domain-containing protein [Spirochaetota bacterium]|nr:carboxyl transferase domain-containing protein [Spirochaetota bacterium]
MGEWMDKYLEKLEVNRLENIKGGGQERIDVQHSLGKLTARERIDRLLDDGTFEEIGSLVRDMRPPYDGKDRPSPADGVIIGSGKVNGRPIMLFSMDFTIMSGSISDQAAWKLAELIQIAGLRRMPLIGIMDSAGERFSIKGGDSGLNALGRLIRNYCLYSGVVPRIMLLLGPCTGTVASLPALSDFLIINEKTGFLWLGGEIESKEAGLADFHMKKSGQCDLIASDDEDAIDKAKELLDYLPQSCWEKPAYKDTGDDHMRRDEELLDVMPDDPKYTYDIHEIIEKIVDNGEFFELKEDFASHMVIGFARFGGHVAGIAANNPEEMSGVFEIDSSDKYDRFINFLDAFNIPLITMVDSTAYVPGDKWERLGIIRHGAKNLHSYSHLTNQKITIVLRRAYGGANIVMGCSQMHPDFVYGWPTGEFAPTGPEAIVQAVFHKELDKAREQGNYDELYNAYVSAIREHMNVMFLSKFWTSYYMIHDAIDPRDTRSKIIKAIQATMNKQEELPKKKTFIKPA